MKYLVILLLFSSCTGNPSTYPEDVYLEGQPLTEEEYRDVNQNFRC